MDDLEISELKDQIDNLVYARTKSEAKPLYNKLNFKASHLGDEIDPYCLGKLKEAIDYAMEASGQVIIKSTGYRVWKDRGMYLRVMR